MMSRRTPSAVRKSAHRRDRTGRRHRWPTCPSTGKQRLGERKDVRLVLDDIREQRARALVSGTATRRRERRGYHCDDCAGWHLTSRPSWSTPKPLAIAAGISTAARAGARAAGTGEQRLQAS